MGGFSFSARVSRKRIIGVNLWPEILNKNGAETSALMTVPADTLVLLGHLGNVKVMLDVDKTAKAHAHFMLGDESL